jgi:hypothetical protein
MSVTFGTPENYRTEFLRFEVARFDCGYNAIIGSPGLAKFMAIPHYPYMILKMPPRHRRVLPRSHSNSSHCWALDSSSHAGEHQVGGGSHNTH